MIGVALAALMAGPGPIASVARAQTAGPSVSGARAFDIPAQPLRDALGQFGRQAGLPVSFASATSAGLRSQPVKGTMAPDEALTRLLGGTGVSWRVAGGAVIVEQAPAPPMASELGAEDGLIVLDAITVASSSLGQGFTEDTPYKTAGSVSHISREQIDRVPPTSAGDMFSNTPGVIAAGNHVGTSVNPNIRGLQGMGRVKVTVDGTEQTTSSYRGYIGSRDETYIDPDLIGGIDITKGPSGGAGGGIGGSVAVRTLLPEDIIPEGKDWGVRLKGGLGGNTRAPSAIGTSSQASDPSFLNSDSWTGSIAAATTSDNFDIIAAFSKRKQGNYFAGSHAPSYFRFPGETNANSIVRPGQEVSNTSEDTQSILLKGSLRWGDGHNLQLGYSRYDSTHGEIMELMYAPWYGNAQRALSQTTVDTYTMKYRWQPAAYSWVNLRANLWMTDLDRVNGSFAPGSAAYGNSQVRTWGGDISNTAAVDVGLVPLDIEVGMNFTREDASTDQWLNGTRWETPGPSGIRKTFGGYVNLRADVTDRIELRGGLRYDYYESRGKGYLADYPDRSEGHLSPNAGITYTPYAGIQLFALYKEGLRPPSLRETHWNYQNLLVNNPDLQGEKAQDIELGLNVLREGVFLPGDNLRLKATLFRNRYRDYIVRASADPASTYPYQWTNIDRADYRGYEISGAYDAGGWFVEAALTRYNSIEYCYNGQCGTPGSADALGRDYTANYIPPKYSGTVSIGARLLDRRLTLGARAQFAGVRFGSDWGAVENETGQVGTNFTWPSYEVYDLFGSYAFNDTTMLNFSIENITDKYYYTALSSGGIPSPGRTARVSLTVTF